MCALRRLGERWEEAGRRDGVWGPLSQARRCSPHWLPPGALGDVNSLLAARPEVRPQDPRDTPSQKHTDTDIKETRRAIADGLGSSFQAAERLGGALQRRAEGFAESLNEARGAQGFGLGDAAFAEKDWLCFARQGARISATASNYGVI